MLLLRRLYRRYDHIPEPYRFGSFISIMMVIMVVVSITSELGFLLLMGLIGIKAYYLTL